jgi:serpin B
MRESIGEFFVGSPLCVAVCFLVSCAATMAEARTEGLSTRGSVNTCRDFCRGLPSKVFCATNSAVKVKGVDARPALHWQVVQRDKNLARSRMDAVEFAPSNIAMADTGLAKAVNSFGLQTYTHSGRGKDNLMLSPVGIYLSLAIAYEGAQGGTKDEMDVVLGVNRIKKPLHDVLGPVIRQINRTFCSDSGALTVGSALWVHRHPYYELKEEFSESVQRAYDSRIREADFRKSPDELAGEINEWVSNATKGRITHLVNREELLPNSVDMTEPFCLLLSAIYFRCPWAQQFWPLSTRQESFFRLDGTVVSVPMMHSFGSDYRYMEGADFQVLELPYEGAPITMIVFLPRKVDGLREFESGLTVESMAARIGELSEWPRGVNVSLPKMSMRPRLDLAPTLKAIGLNMAFERKSKPRDLFFGILGRKSDVAAEPALFLTKVIHDTRLDVTEVGTEAVGSITIQMSSSVALSGEENKPRVFRADHPFMFIIYHKPSGCILFMGRVTDPSKTN